MATHLNSIVNRAQRIELKANRLEESGVEKKTRKTIKLLFLLIKKHPLVILINYWVQGGKFGAKCLDFFMRNFQLSNTNLKNLVVVTLLPKR